LFFDPWFSIVKKKVGDTVYGIGWLPLGGYVKISGMIDESMDKEQLKQPAQSWEFRSKPAWQRLIIMIGGVTVNILLAFFIYAMILFTWGETKLPNESLKQGVWVVDTVVNEIGLKNKWIDVRGLIQTDNSYREGKVDFELTETLVKRDLQPIFNSFDIIVTQGFIGGTSENFTTTLGREGSDYTASILAYCLNANNVTIWKDVPGVLNADPKWFSHTKKIDELSYHDAIELTYYGATVIHPKTIKPLQNKNIPLYVKSFLKPKDVGTVIRDGEKRLNIPSYIFKIDQVLISIQPKDFSFIAEDNLSDIFEVFSKHGVKINLMQLSAISFSVCCDDYSEKIKALVAELQQQFKVLYNSGLELMTVRYYTQETLDILTTNKIILLEQRSRFTVQMVMKNEIAE
jgi:aspartate kinase